LDVNRAKIQFSDTEQRLMRDTGIILTKNNVIAGMVKLFAALQQSLEQDAANTQALAPYLPQNSKISKGENYLGLPYVILDYPRYFDGKNIFAIRTMFWWGRFFSMTMHLSGEEKNKYQQKIEEARLNLAEMNAFIGINEDPWQHHFENDNYIKVSGLSEQNFLAHCRQHDHLKIACNWPLEEINEIDVELNRGWKKMVEIII
jgi:hypothetical protein